MVIVYYSGYSTIGRLGNGHVERKSEDDWMSACRNVVVAGVRCAGRGRKTWYECVKDDMKALGLHPVWAVFRDMWRGFISGGTSNPSGKIHVFKINEDDDEVGIIKSSISD